MKHKNQGVLFTNQVHDSLISNINYNICLAAGGCGTFFFLGGLICSFNVENVRNERTLWLAAGSVTNSSAGTRPRGPRR